MCVCVFEMIRLDFVNLFMKFTDLKVIKCLGWCWCKKISGRFFSKKLIILKTNSILFITLRIRTSKCQTNS